MEAAADPLLPDESTDDAAPEVKVERVEPKDPEEAAMRYVAAVEKMQADMGSFPPYYVEMTAWDPVVRGRKVKLSTHVQIPRAMLKALIVMRGILQEFEEDVPHTRLQEEEDLTNRPGDLPLFPEEDEE